MKKRTLERGDIVRGLKRGAKADVNNPNWIQMVQYPSYHDLAAVANPPSIAYWLERSEIKTDERLRKSLEKLGQIQDDPYFPESEEIKKRLSVAGATIDEIALIVVSLFIDGGQFKGFEIVVPAYKEFLDNRKRYDLCNRLDALADLPDKLRRAQVFDIAKGITMRDVPNDVQLSSVSPYMRIANAIDSVLSDIKHISECLRNPKKWSGSVGKKKFGAPPKASKNIFISELQRLFFRKCPFKDKMKHSWLIRRIFNLCHESCITSDEIRRVLRKNPLPKKSASQ